MRPRKRQSLAQRPAQPAAEAPEPRRPGLSRVVSLVAVIVADPRLQLVLDLVGVFVFALSGALVAVRKGLDLFGILVLAAVAGLGGGLVRDVLLNTVPVAVTDWRLLAAAAAGGLATFFFHPGIGRIARPVRVLDAAGLGAFAVAGALKALSFGIGPFGAVVVGTITAIGGGMLRDVLAREVPEVLQRELYAVPAILGATVVAVASATGHLDRAVVLGAAAMVFVLRLVAVVLDLNAPRALRSR